MSDTEMNTPADAGAVSKDFADMPQGDIDFIMTCIQNAIDGALTVDSAKIASKLGYNNPRSVGNRIGQIKKKYGLAIKASTSKATTDADGTVATPRTPNKVTKTLKAPRTKATPTPAKGKKTAVKKSVETDVDMAGAEGDEEGGASLTVKDDTEDAVLETPTKPKKTPVKRTPATKKTPSVKKSPGKNFTAKKEVKSEEKVEEDEDADMEEGDVDLSVKAIVEEVKPEGVAE